MIAHHNQEAEDVLLGLILLNDNIMDTVVGIVDRPEMFYVPKNQIVYRAMLSQYNANDPISNATLMSVIGTDSDVIGGRTYLYGLVERAAGHFHVEHYAKNIAENYQRRKLSRWAEEIKHIADSSDMNSSDLIADFDSKLMQIQEINISNYRHIGEGSEEFKQRIADFQNSAGGISTGFTNMDHYVVGLEAGDLVYLAGATSMGKTAFSIQLSMNMMQKYRVGYITLEMSEEQMKLRMVAHLSGFDVDLIKKGHSNKATEAAIAEVDRLAQYNMWMCDDNLNMSTLKSTARKMKRVNKIDVLFVDYLGKIGSTTNMDIKTKFSTHSDMLKKLARDLEIPIICLAQLRRLDKNAKKPSLSDLKESGDLENDADHVWLLYRPKYYGTDILMTPQGDIADQNATEVMIAKHRNGATGSCYFATQLGCSRYTPITNFYNDMEYQYKEEYDSRTTNKRRSK